MKSSDMRTAKIYAFPARPRANSAAGRLARLEAEAHQVARVEFGSCWYHDEAIAESKAGGKGH